MFNVIILLGPPGSGKGTQAELLEKNFGFKKLSTGDMLRSISKENTELALTVKQIMESGGLISDDLVIKVVTEALEKLSSTNGVILDGFPRTIAQAQYLDKILKENDVFKNSKVKIIAMEIDENLVIERISGRFSCKQCLAGYHDLFKMQKISGRCDDCGGTEFVRRQDDKKETVIKRLKAYNQDTFPIVNFYKKQGELKILDSSLPIDTVYQELHNIVTDISSSPK